MNPRRAAVAVFLVALAVRVVLLLSTWDPVDVPQDDEKGYAGVARSLAEGRGFHYITPTHPRSIGTCCSTLHAFRAPLLSLVLAPVPLAGGDLLAMRFACAVLGALAAPLAFVVARRIGGDVAGWIAGLAVALWPSHAWLSVRVLSEPLDALLLLAAADLLLRKRFAAGGGALGLAVLCRPGGLSAAFFASLATALGEPVQRRVRVLAITMGVVSAVVAPWLVRNWVHFGRPLLVTSSGVTLLGGNCDAALEADAPGKWVPPDKSWTGSDPPDGMYGWEALGERRSSDRLAAAARTWVRENPGKAARLACWKVVRFLDPDTHSEKPDAGLKRLLGWVSWGPVLPLVAVAIWLGRRERRPEWLMAIALLAGHLMVAVNTYGDARMRAPVEPALIALLVAPLLAGWYAKWTAARAAATVPG